ncbi:hypothetical protein RQP46_010893 [Phenoliferia psychrophenolica]
MGIGLFSAGAECLAPITITDIFFAHERGTYMGFYTVFLSIGVSTGNWRDIYWVASGLIGAVGLLVLFTFPAFSVTIGFLVAITTNFAVATGAPPYNFTTLQSSLCFIGGIVGGFLGIPFAGPLSDLIVRRATHKNDGIREPEMRLKGLYPYIVLGPLALILYGVGLDKGVHWICPVVGLALLLFTVVGVNSLALMYTLDVYKPIAPEVVAAVVGFKGIIGFGLSFGTTAWVDSQGYSAACSSAVGEMALITGVVLAMAIPLNIWGARIRQASFQWRITSWIKWDVDRDDVAATF